MPELPDVEAYLHALRRRIQGRTLRRIRRASPFILRTALPPIGSAEGRDVVELRRLGKRVCIGLDGALWLVIHLMIAGRLHWKSPEAKLDGRYGLAALDFDDGSLVLSEAGSKKRASLRLVEGEAGLAALDPGGVEPLGCTVEAFAAALQRGNHTLKRALTDPHLLAGIGNAYSDEILHAAKLSPLALTARLDEGEIARLHAATQVVLRDWVGRLCAEADEAFPEKVTAFRKGMAAHGRYGEPCPDCGTAIQRIRYASNEANYCPRCQTEGRLLADRGLSRLLGKDWPRTIEELEEARR
ncbi:MAG TPA: DNA-formamidopyrimidine glycosylase family protein [Geminicoccaceae bacterium]|nr:DNA-formamidopyrimidine glycosylase family protein [Geminicoccus sp.]HMU51462.1 DNA-formamidopyrimidine glycosylase family protein [Geminicoccaceae bacterium]